MNKADVTNIEAKMILALANYAGPVTLCPPDNARAPAEVTVVKNASVKWLKQNRNATPIRDAKAARRLTRMARAKQQRITKTNAMLLKRVKD